MNCEVNAVLMIRDEQIQTLEEAATRSFERRMVAHLREHFPEECRRAGEERLIAAIRQGVGRAQKYGIVCERDVARYVDLSVVLGLDFDSGKRYPWAREILTNSVATASEKLSDLLDNARRSMARRTKVQPVG